eukprot:748190-Hanusia_phi.AAC.1
MDENNPNVDSDASGRSASISFSQARAVFANSAAAIDDEAARATRSNSASPSSSKSKSSLNAACLDAGWGFPVKNHSNINPAAPLVPNGQAAVYHPGLYLQKCTNGTYTIRSSELSVTHYDVLTVGVEVHAINGEILKGLAETEVTRCESRPAMNHIVFQVANLLLGKEETLVSFVICAASQGFESTNLCLMRGFQLRGQPLVQHQDACVNTVRSMGSDHVSVIIDEQKLH